MRELEGGLDGGIAVDETRGRWGVSEIGDAGSSGVEVERKGALCRVGALCVEIKNGGKVVGWVR